MKKAEKKEPNVKKAVSKTSNTTNNNKSKFINKEKLLSIINIKNYNFNQQINFLCIVLSIVFIIGLFFPLLGVNVDLSIKGDETSNKNLTLISPDNNLYKVNTTDLIFRKPLPEHKVYGTKIDDFEIFNIPIYSTLTTPIPSAGILEKINNTLNGDWVAWLTDENITNFCIEKFPTFGEQIVNIATNVSYAIENIKGIMNDTVTAVDYVRDISNTICETNQQILNYKGIVETTVTILTILIILSIVLFIIRKGPKYLPAILLSIETGIFLLLGIGTVITNIIISNNINPAINQINTSLHSLLNDISPAISPIISMLTGSDGYNLYLKVQAFCAPGFWIMFIALIIMTFIAYFVPKHNSLKSK